MPKPEQVYDHQVFAYDLSDGDVLDQSIECCDCGLVHSFKFQMVADWPALLTLRISRDNKATVLARKRRKKGVT